MEITILSDLHGFYPKLEGGDLLVVAGDLTAKDRPEEYDEFNNWIAKQKYQTKVVIAGNHDNLLQKDRTYLDPEITYLQDSGTEFEGLKVWGSPWTKRFDGMNPKCMAFTVDTDDELAEKWAMIPEDTGILITHSPPLGIYDQIKHTGDYVGSKSLRCKIDKLNKLLLHCFGHIHECGCRRTKLVGFGKEMYVVNASYVDENYTPVNNAMRIVL